MDDAAIAAEIAPAFVEAAGRRTDTLVLACTHYPLLVATLERLAPWPVTFIDPAPAIARRVDTLLVERGLPAPEDGPVVEAREPLQRAAIFTSRTEPAEALRAALRARGLGDLHPF